MKKLILILLITFLLFSCEKEEIISLCEINQTCEIEIINNSEKPLQFTINIWDWNKPIEGQPNTFLPIWSEMIELQPNESFYYDNVLIGTCKVNVMYGDVFISKIELEVTACEIYSFSIRYIF